MKKSILIAALALVAGALPLFVVPFFMPWTPLNCRHQEVDINTGRLRFSGYLLYRKVSERIEDSALTTVLPPELLKSASPEWHRVNTFSPGVGNSPHYAFHGAIHQIRELTRAWELLGFSDELRRKTALHLLAIWKHSGTDSLASEYISELYKIEESPQKEQVLQKLSNLEMPRVDKQGDQLTFTVFYPNGQPMDRYQAYFGRDGKAVMHGLWEKWYPDGRRQLYGHWKDGLPDGRTFE